MFTGIIQSVGKLVSSRQDRGGCVLVVSLGSLDSGAVHPGDSISVNGTCLTVTSLEDDRARFDVSPETLSRCLVGEWRVGDPLNLEPALTLQTPLGGHMVSGHVDGTAQVVARMDETDFSQIQFAVPRALGRFIAGKGSVALDGISLTSNDVVDVDAQTRFSVSLVPHTLEHTTLGAVQPGQRVHVEIDPLARYLDRMLEERSA